jgi:DNA replication protein DnaC
VVEGDFVERKENLLVFGSTGAGKTHLSCAIGHELVNGIYSVLYIDTCEIVQKLLAAKKECKLHEAFKKLDKCLC